MRTTTTETDRPEIPPLPEGRRVIRNIAALALGVRLVLQLLGTLAWSADGRSLGGRTMLDFWVHWDANHYLRIAEVGYRSSGEDALYIVFFPAYPVLVRLVAFVVRDLAGAAMLISMAASVGAAWFLYRLIRLDAGHEQAWRGVVLLFSFPTAYYLFAPYTESLFLFAVLGCVYAARTGRWAGVAAAGALATTTRLAGVALLPGLALEAVRQTGFRLASLRRLSWAALAGTGVLVYLGMNVAVHGDPLAFVGIQGSHWHNRAAWPWRPLVDAVAGLGNDGVSTDLLIIFWGRLGGTAVAVALLVAGLRWLHPMDSVYGWTALLLVLASTWLISLPRYLLGIYPLLLVLARLTRPRPAFAAAVAIGGGLQAFLFWRYALGWWTF